MALVKRKFIKAVVEFMLIEEDGLGEMNEMELVEEIRYHLEREHTGPACFGTAGVTQLTITELEVEEED